MRQYSHKTGTRVSRRGADEYPPTLMLKILLILDVLQSSFLENSLDRVKPLLFVTFILNELW